MQSINNQKRDVRIFNITADTKSDIICMQTALGKKETFQRCVHQSGARIDVPADRCAHAPMYPRTDVPMDQCAYALILI